MNTAKTSVNTLESAQEALNSKAESARQRFALIMSEREVFMSLPQVYVRIYKDRDFKDCAYGFIGTVGDIVNDAGEVFIPENCRCKTHDHECNHQESWSDAIRLMSGPDALEYAVEILGGWSFNTLKEGKAFFIEKAPKGWGMAFNKLEQLEEQ